MLYVFSNRLCRLDPVGIAVGDHTFVMRRAFLRKLAFALRTAVGGGQMGH